ncbi:MAG: aminoglycoside phosphotransferase family protein [Deltaproteobacteria bacterium]|nr:aminoglycoside phosphotransferase family protein [Deltaproteobacteria bacterium]
MNELLIIPAAHPVAPDLQFEFGPISPCAIPIEGKPALSYILAQHVTELTGTLTAESLSTIVVTSKHVPVDFVPAQTMGSCNVVEVEYTRDIGHTVLQALETSIGPKHLVVNFADTVVKCATATLDYITFAKSADTGRWTSFTLDESGAIDEIIDKSNTHSNAGNVFCGVFSFSDARLFEHLLRQFIALNTNEESFYLALREYTRLRKVTWLEAAEWSDFGHIDNYYALQRNISKKAREFNSQDLSPEKGVIRKRSTRTEDLIHEIQWYLKLPKAISYISPRVIDYSLDLNKCYLDMDFYSYLSLQDIWLYSRFDMATWENIFSSVFENLKDMSRFTVLEDGKGSVKKALVEMYSQKTLNRMRQYVDEPQFSKFLRSTIQINGEVYPGIRETMAGMEDNLQREGLLDCEHFSIIHGDYCFSNILFDRRIGVAKLIDPRGKFGEFDVYGDPRYDYAKLCHSILGNYDFFVQNQFDITETKDGYAYTANYKAHHERIRNLFLGIYAKKTDHSLRQIRLLESLLFLSMVPLHKDNLKGQLAFVCRGLEIYHNALKGNLAV